MGKSSDAPEVLAPGQVLGGCEIVRRTGRGGMGFVYEAIQLSLKRRVALKILAPRLATKARFVARFDRESVSLASLSHPHIVSIFDRGVDGDLYYFTMEYVAGDSLRDRLRKGTLAPAETWRITDQVLSALELAHESGVVHRDIKPENILLDAHGRAKVADFGIAHLERNETTEVEDGKPAVGNLTVGNIGTPNYMAPEQRARRASDHRVDLYAIGVLCFELLTGRLPKNEVEALSALPAGVGVPACRFLWRLLAPDPNDRFSSAKAAREALAAAIAPAPGPTAVPAPTAAILAGAAPSRPKPPARWSWSVAAIVAVGLISLGGGIWSAWGTTPGGAGATTRPPARNGAADTSAVANSVVTPSPPNTGNSAPANRSATISPPTNAAVPPTNAAEPPTNAAEPPGNRTATPGNAVPTVDRAGAEARAGWAEAAQKLEACLAADDLAGAQTVLADFRLRHAPALRTETGVATALAEGAHTLEAAARSHFDAAQAEAARLRDQGQYAAAVQAIGHAGGYGVAVLDEAAREFVRRTLRAACDADSARARELRDGGRWHDALVAYRHGLEYAEETSVVVALNGEIAALKRGVRAGITDVLDRLEMFVRNGRFDYPDELAKLEQDPERAELLPFLRSVREDLEGFRAGKPAPRDIVAQWRMRLDKTEVTLGDRAGIPPAERCERCEGTGGDACGTCAGKGTVPERCTECHGEGLGTCRKCDGQRVIRCETCVGKGKIPKRTRTQCETCAPKRCPVCHGTGFGIGFGLCGNCGGDGWLGSAGRLAGKLCPDCKGAKSIQTTEHLPCPACEQKGVRTCPLCRGAGKGKCAACEGSGKVGVPCPDCAGAAIRPCPRCKGSGRRPAK